MEGLAGKRALVTGGAAGIGRAIALELARSGCDIALIDVDAGKAETTAGEVRALGRKAAAAVGDVSDAGSVRAALAKLAGEPFDILVNNAGICRLAPLLTMSEKDWRETMAINVDGIFNVSRAVVPDMVARKRGAVVNLASWLGRRGTAAVRRLRRLQVRGHRADPGAGAGGGGLGRARQCGLPRTDRRHADARCPR